LQRGAEVRESDSRWERRQRRIAALMFVLIPLAIPAGIFAPNFIAVVTTVDRYPGETPANEDTRVALDHEPLRHPRHFPQGVTPPQTHTAKFARLFRPTPSPQESPLPDLPKPPQPSPALATFDVDAEPSAVDPGDPIETVDFFDSDEGDGNEEWPTEYFVAGLPAGDSYTQPPPVPEPGSGVLLGAGLIALAVRRRSLRSARAPRLRPGS
jgi:hypothetical protein